jgi:hypothetical protein
MSKIHNMIRTLGAPGTEEFELPEGWEVGHVVYLGPTNEQERAAGFYKILYVLVPVKSGALASAVRKPGRPPKNE